MSMAVTMERPVLVLNKTWTPLNTTSMKRALKMVLKGRAKIVNIEDFQAMSWEDWSNCRPSPDDPHFTACGQVFRVPEIIVLQHYDKVPRPRTHFSRRTLFRRDNHRCQYCGCQPGTEELTIDHVLPRAQGGVTSWENCVLACIECNAFKANRTPEQARMKLLTTPARPKYAVFKMPSIKIASWEQFLGVAYWELPLQD